MEGSAYDNLRQFDELERVLQRKMIVLPDADTELRLALARAKKNDDWPGLVREVQRLDPRLDDEARIGWRIQTRDFAGALEALQAVKGDRIGLEQRSQVLGDIQAFLGNRAAADAAYRELETWARKKLAEMPPPKSPEDEQLIRFRKARLAMACALVNKKEEALRLAEEAQSPSSDEMEPADRFGLFRMAADVFARAGEMSRAISIYRNLLEVPSGLTRFELRNDPFFDEFRKNPEFAALISEPGP